MHVHTCTDFLPCLSLTCNKVFSSRSAFMQLSFIVAIVISQFDLLTRFIYLFEPTKNGARAYICQAMRLISNEISSTNRTVRCGTTTTTTVYAAREEKRAIRNSEFDAKHIETLECTVRFECKDLENHILMNARLFYSSIITSQNGIESNHFYPCMQ